MKFKLVSPDKFTFDSESQMAAENTMSQWMVLFQECVFSEYVTLNDEEKEVSSKKKKRGK